TATSECRLQQSLSTPCPQEDQTSRKDSEYRRFKSEGSSAGALPAGPEMEVAIDDLSPIADASSTSPHRFNLIADRAADAADSSATFRCQLDLFKLSPNGDDRKELSL
ncbi:hypothetical protein TELCIR_23040, partial [Teladorsagia circumcincta]